MEPLDLNKFKKTQGPSPSPTAIDLGKFKKPVQSSTFAESPEIASQRRLQQAQEDQVAFDKEAEKGFLGRFGKSLVKTIAPSEVGLGKSIASIIFQGSKVDKGLQEQIATASDIEVQLLKQIRENEAKGLDTTKLKKAYNDSVSTRERTQGKASELTQLPSNMKVAGQLGGTALDILTAGTYGKSKTGAMTTGKLFSGGSGAAKSLSVAAGAPELGKAITQKTKGLILNQGVIEGVKSAGRVAGNVVAGALPGYASDVAMGLQGERGEDREGVNALIPGVGTLFGATIAGTREIGATINNFRNPDAFVSSKRVEALGELQKKYTKVDKAIKAAEAKGAEVQKMLTETNLLNGAVDADGLITKDAAMVNFDEFIEPFEGQVRKSLEEEGKTIAINNLATQADEFVKNSKLTGQAKVQLANALNGDLKGFAMTGNQVPLTTLHDTKVFRNSNSNYMDTGADEVSKEAARFFKELVENNSFAMDVKNYNKELAKFYAVRDVIKALDRTRVSGGRLGKYFSSVVGGMVGGSAFGPLGTIAGAEAGSLYKGSQMEQMFGGNINKGLAPTKKLLESLKPTATGAAAIPDLVLPKKNPEVPELDLRTANQSSVIQSSPPSSFKASENSGQLLEQKVTKELDDILKKAVPATLYIDDEANALISGIEGTRLSQAPVKGFDRAFEKVMDDYKGDTTKLRDAARNSIVFTKPETQEEILDAMLKRDDIAKYPDGTPMYKIQTPDKFMGYEGAIFSIMTPQGIIAETQVVSAPMTYGKLPEDAALKSLGKELYERIKKITGVEAGRGHVIYEQIRSLDKTSPTYAEDLRKLEEQSVDYYSKLSNIKL